MILDDLKKYDMNTYLHCERVANLAVKIGEYLHCTKKELKILHDAALYHDVGKLKVSLSILNKRDPLTMEDWAVIKNHPIHSLNLIKNEITDPMAREIVLYHHENMNGTGYYKIPNISLLNQIVCVSDIYDALTSDRPYRNGFTKEKAMEIMREDHNYSDYVLNALEANL